MSRPELRVGPLPGGPGRVSAAIELPDGEVRILKLAERTDHLSGPDRSPLLDGDYEANGGDLTWAAVGVIPLAMNLGADLVVDGVVQKGMRGRLAEFSEIWHGWRPDLFEALEVRAEGEVTLPADRSGSVVAFSGGLDSLHTLRHARQVASGDPVVAVRLWGFDYQKRDSYFLEVARHAAKVLDGIGVRLALVETNWGEVGSVSIPMDYATGLVSALEGFANRFGQGFSGADYHSDMAERFIPCGHNPFTDHLLSSGEFPVETFGYDHTRLEKAEDVAGDPAALELLRVCNAFNCGVCEKCQRTRWGLFSAGVDRPPTFGYSLPLPRPWISIGNQWKPEVLDSMWTPILEKASTERPHTGGLWKLRIQHAMLRWQVEGRGPWRAKLPGRFFELLAKGEKRFRGAVEKLRWRLRGRRWKRYDHQS
jgi:hypothetical protein